MIVVNRDSYVDSPPNFEDVALYVAYTVHSRLSMLKARRKSTAPPGRPSENVGAGL
jgi:hypothetical protein